VRPTPPVTEVDPFDLPDWLGTVEVTWTARTGLRGAGQVTGDLAPTGGDGEAPLPCDVLAVDQAYPEPVVDEQSRRAVHRAWTLGQVLLVEYDDRLTLAVPGTELSAAHVLEALGRLAKAVGVKPDRFAATLRL
jgi:hypothetical protein